MISDAAEVLAHAAEKRDKMETEYKEDFQNLLYFVLFAENAKGNKRD